MKLQYTFCAALVLAVMANAAAQPAALELTVDDAARIALEGNLSLRRSALTLEGKQRAAGRSWNDLIPSVNAAATVSRPTSITGEIPAARDVWTPGVSVSAAVSLSASTVENIKKAQADYAAGVLNYEQARQELELQARKLFYQIILLDANRELAAQSLESAQARYAQSAALAKVGQAARLDEMSAKVDMENQRPNLRSAEIACENAVDSFKSLLNIPREQAVTLNGSLDFDGGIITGADNETANNESLETAALLKTIQSLEAQKKAAQYGAYTPSLRLAWNTAPMYTISDESWNDGSGSFSVSLGMNIDNFLPWSSAKTQIDSLTDSISAAGIQLSESLQNRESRITQYRRTIESTVENIETLKLNVELAAASYAMCEEAYRKGAADYQRLRDAAVSLEQAKNRVRQEQYNLVSAVLDLEKELNVPFGTLTNKSTMER
jgi:outer membrane protein TolC